ncbi:MAG TPA: IS3 family transposase, partial [Mizugakiibacter sp.]|nr:IS3 family transposase [Mizugakiibacter sp.]
MKQMAITLIDEAVLAGARCHKATEVLGISCRTLRRWRAAGDLTDGRRGAPRTCPHALSGEEKAQILDVCNSPEYKSLPPSQIVPRLADQGIYMASESSFYRILKARGQDNHRGRAQAPRTVSKPTAWSATAPNQVWSWDITYLPTAVCGQFYRLYMLMDIYSRMIVGWEVHREELSDHAAVLMEKACLRHGIAAGQLVLHADNGGPMKGATMLATLQRLGVVPSFSRPSVSNDNPYSESAFKTLKYVPSYPKQPFESLNQARDWVQHFVTWYNTEHRHSGIRFVTPQQRHQGQDYAI